MVVDAFHQRLSTDRGDFGFAPVLLERGVVLGAGPHCLVGEFPVDEIVVPFEDNFRVFHRHVEVYHT